MFGIFTDIKQDIFSGIDDKFKMKINGRYIDHIDKVITISLMSNTTKSMNNSTKIFNCIANSFMKALGLINEENAYKWVDHMQSTKRYDMSYLIGSYKTIADGCSINANFSKLEDTHYPFEINDDMIECTLDEKTIEMIDDIGYNILYEAKIINVFKNNKSSRKAYKHSINQYIDLYFIPSISNSIIFTIKDNINESLNYIESFIVNNSYVDTFKFRYNISSMIKDKTLYKIFKRDKVSSFSTLMSRLDSFGHTFINYLPPIVDITPFNHKSICPEDPIKFIWFEIDPKFERGIRIIYEDNSYIDFTNSNIIEEVDKPIKHVIETLVVDQRFYAIDLIICNNCITLHMDFIARYNMLSNVDIDLPIIERVNSFPKDTKSLIIYPKHLPYNNMKLYRIGEPIFTALAKKESQINTYSLHTCISNNLLSVLPIQNVSYGDKMSIIPFNYPIISENKPYSTYIYSTEDLNNKVINFKFEEFKPKLIEIDKIKTLEFKQNNYVFSTYKSLLYSLFSYEYDGNCVQLPSNIFDYIIYSRGYKSMLSTIPYSVATSNIEKMTFLGYLMSTSNCIKIFNNYMNLSSPIIGRANIKLYDLNCYDHAIQKVSESTESIDFILVNDKKEAKNMYNVIHGKNKICGAKSIIAFVGDQGCDLSNRYERLSLLSIVESKEYKSYIRQRNVKEEQNKCIFGNKILYILNIGYKAD